MAVESSTALRRSSGFSRGSSAQSRARKWWRGILVGVFLAVTVAGCGRLAPADRVVAIEVSGCGDAFDGRVGGVVVAEEKVVTVAHAVAQADAISVGWGGRILHGEVVGYDSRSDLALIAVSGLDGSDVEFGEPASGEVVTLVGGLVSGDLEVTVDQVLTIRIEQVLGTERVERAGLELRVAAAVGDSGSGLFDKEGRLAGILFAVNDDGSEVGWATAASEVSALLSQPPVAWTCDPARSRLVSFHQD